MRKLKIFLLFVIMSTTGVHATVCAYKYYIEKHVNLSVCRNHGRFSMHELIYNKGLAKALSDYIGLRIERGELENKKFEIEFLDPILTRPHIVLTQGKRGYYIQTGEQISLQGAMNLVDEFTRPGFTILDLNVWDLYGEESENEWHRIVGRMSEILNREPLEDMEKVLTNTYTLWEKGALKIEFAEGGLYYELHGKRLEEKINAGLPGVIRDRYIIQQEDAFVLYEDSVFSKRIEIDTKDMWEGSMTAEVTPKWVNFKYWDDYVYSYSYEKNRFYKIEKDK